MEIEQDRSRAPRVDIPAGAAQVWMRDGVEASGRFVEVDPPHRLVFTWGWRHDHAVVPGSTRVEVTLEETDGGTLVVLRHYDLPDDEQRTHHAQGWTMYLDRLAALVALGGPGADPLTAGGDP